MKIKIRPSFVHMKKDLFPKHGPQVWPWYKLVSFLFLRCNPHITDSKVVVYRLWIYTRFGAPLIDFIVDFR